MPLYEYQCETCGRFEIIRKFSDAPLACCPTCSGDVQKLLSAPAFQFKGTGWYVTDYARKSPGGGETKPDSTSASKDASTPKDTTSKNSSASGSSPTE